MKNRGRIPPLAFKDKGKTAHCQDIGGRKMLEVILDILGIVSSIAVIVLVWKGWRK